MWNLFSRVWVVILWTVALQVFSVHGILQARILEWIAISFSRGSSWSRDWTHRRSNKKSVKYKETWDLLSGSSCCCSVTKSCPALCDPIDCSTPGFPFLLYLPEFAKIHVQWVSNAFQPSHPLLPLSPLALSPSQHQGLFQWVTSSHQVAKVLELQHQFFQWIFRVDFL